MKIALVFNPVSGGYREPVLVALETALTEAGHGVTRYDSLSLSHADAAPDVDCYCISGGDGTARLVLENPALRQPATQFCIHPTGTINLIARELGYPSAPVEMAHKITGAPKPRPQFLGRINTQIFLACASVGPDSLAVDGVSVDLKRKIGRFAYGVSLAKLLWRWPRLALRVTADGMAHHAEAVFILKARYYAGPWVVDPQARFDRPAFRVLMMPRARRRDFARLALYCVSGGRFADERWRFLDARNVAIDGDVSAPVQADGDIVTHLPARLSVDPDPVDFL